MATTLRFLFKWYALGFIDILIFDKGIWARINPLSPTPEEAYRLSLQEIEVILLFENFQSLSIEIIIQYLFKYSKQEIQTLCNNLVKKNIFIDVPIKRKGQKNYNSFFYLAEPYNRFFENPPAQLSPQDRFTNAQWRILEQFKINCPLGVEKAINIFHNQRKTSARRDFNYLLKKGILVVADPVYYGPGFYYLAEPYKKYLKLM